MNTQKIQACPFCGEQWCSLRNAGNNGVMRQVYCRDADCGARGPIRPSEDHAIAAWNNRAGGHQPATHAEADGVVPFASASGCAASKDLALQNWMQDVTSLLCYQPEVPHAHKESLVKALDHYTKQCAELDEAKRHNAEVRDPAT